MKNRIAFVKTGWADKYQGDPVIGRHANLGEGNERFNFQRTEEDGPFYGHLPPIGENSRPPQPKTREDWLVIFVAARNGNGPLTVVGWYDNATFETEYTDRPEYQSANGFQFSANGGKYKYCLSSAGGHLIPVLDRNITISGKHFGRIPIIYARGNGKNDGWRKKFAKIAEEIVASEKPNLPRGNPAFKFPDQEHRDKVEKASIKEAVQFLESQTPKYVVTDKQKYNLGYDLLAERERPPKELHVEVKGTSIESMHFFITRNEKQHMSNPQWRLIIVTDALNAPQASLMTEK